MVEIEKKDLLQVRELKKYFPVKGGVFSRVQSYVKAVDSVSFSLSKNRTFGLVGESGCGKTTLGRSLLRLIEPTGGQIFFDGDEITQLSKEAMLAKRRDMQIVFQDPYASLNPRFTVLETVLEPLNVHNIGSKGERIGKVENLLELVGLRKNVMNRYPHEFSGGQRQRVGIARALASRPKFIVADEPVSSLDVSVQSQVLNLISDLQEKFGIAFLFISHDLAIVQHVSHEVGVMYLGKLVEKASVENLYQDPKHPYTKALLSAVPLPDPKTKRKRIILPGDVPSPQSPPEACPFHPRCPQATPKCSKELPSKIHVGKSGDEHWVKCHLFTEK